jgi:Na(+)-translocating NADH:ubiquinone oxidoreductase F subunit
MSFTPGDYMQIDIPAYEEIRYRDFDIPEPYASVWERQHVFNLVAKNPEGGERRNNYSVASNAATDRTLTFNVRIATPPPGQDCPPGIGSSYIFNLKPGDTVTAIGSFGDFHIKPTQKEMVYIGGGAGMAPMRAHISHMLETEKTSRKMSFWYGARSRQEIFYDDFFERLAAEHPNFSFHLALSNPLDENHPNLKAVEFYLCGPPMMMKACNKMLADLGVPPSQISFDAF